MKGRWWLAVVVKGRWWLAVVMAGVLVMGGHGFAQDKAPAPPAPAGDAGAAPPAPEAAAPDEEDEAMVLNFERVDIRELIHSLASELGVSYTIDPRIEGQVTLRTTGKIAREDLWPLLNQILRNNGIAAVKVGDVYQVLPVAEAKTRAIIPREESQLRSAKTQDNFVIEIFPVQHVSADEMVNVLQPFVTPGGDVLSYPRSNLVVVTDLQSNVDRLRDLVNTFDTNVFRDLHTRVFKMEHGDPEELANELLGILAPYGVTPTGEGEGGLYVIPLPRLNSLVVIAYDKSIFLEVERWLKLLDIPPDEGAGRQTFVYPVENAKAVDLADVLNELFGGGTGGGAGGFGRAPGAAPAGVGLFGAGGVSGGGAAGRTGGGRRGGIGGAGGAGGGGGLGQQAGGLGQQAGGQQAGGLGGQAGGGAGGGRRLGGRGGGGAGGRGGGAVGAPGGGAVAVSLPGGPLGAGAPGQLQGPPPIFKQEVRIVADEVTNSLIILATRRDYQLILEVLKKVDVMPRQVVLEVMIAEIGLNDDLQYGVTWALAEGGSLNSVDPKLNPDSDSVFRNRNRPDAMGLLNRAVERTPASGFFGVIGNQQDFQMFINALAVRANVKMLSAPHIIAADNREAHILVGESIPILTSSSQSTVGNSNVVNSVQYRDTGKILTILPQVNSKGLVHMQIRQEVSAVDVASFGQTQSPSFRTREAETTCVVQDGAVVIIGGIIDDQVNHVRTGVPFFMDIPVLGYLFRTEANVSTRTELMIAITPYVVRNRDEARDVTELFVNRVEGLKRMRGAIRRRMEQRKPLADPPPLTEEGIDMSGKKFDKPVVPPEAAP